MSVLDRLRRRQSRATEHTLPALSMDAECYEFWVDMVGIAAAGRWVVRLTWRDGVTRDATIIGAGFYGQHFLAGIEVAYWTGDRFGDQEPPADAATEVIYSDDLTEIHVY